MSTLIIKFIKMLDSDFHQNDDFPALLLSHFSFIKHHDKTKIIHYYFLIHT